MLRFFTYLALAASGTPPARAASLPVMPMPVKAERAPGRLVIGAGFSVAAAGCGDARLDAALDRFVERIARQTGILMAAGRLPDGTGALLRVECPSGKSDYPALGIDESYTLDVSAEDARIQSVTLWGTLHALATFAQLIGPGPQGWEVPVIHVDDRPRFAWRGLMLDVSRHWMPVEVIERNLNAMAAVKLNVFHWHLSDDQAFRVESLRYPRLHEMGSDGRYYTQEEIRRIVSYARDRGIRVVPEFDIPGHTTSWFAAYPELASAPGIYSIARNFGVFDPAMDPSREETYTFLDGFFEEMTALFPDPYFHIGGDEVSGSQWSNSPGIQAFAREHGLPDNGALQAYFNQRVSKLLQKRGKIMIGWDEVLNPALPKSTVIQSWRRQAALAEAAAQGYSGILSSGYYLDHLSPASYHYSVDPLAGAGAQLNSEAAARILGGEACMWAELVDAETVDSRIWPRAAAIAERLWSPRETADGASMYDRLEAISRALEWTGVRHRDNYAAMLDRLAGGRPAGPLRRLADVCEALGLGPRRAAADYTTQTPLNRLVDAARPESERVRSLERGARVVAAAGAGSAPDSVRLREEFRQWMANDAAFQELAEGNSLLDEARPLSKDLARLGSMGTATLNYLQSGKPAPAEWLARQARELARISKPSAEINLAAARPVKVLLDALAKRSRTAARGNP